MRRALTFFALSGALHVLPAFAQTYPVTVNIVPEQFQRLNLDEIADDTYITLQFSVQNFTVALDYELTYDQVRSNVGTSTVTLIDLDPNIDQPKATDALTNSTVLFKIRPSQIVRKNTEPEDDAFRDIFVRVYPRGQPPNPNVDGSQSWRFRYDTKRPPIPQIGPAFAGENRVIVSWSAAVPDTHVATYDVLYCPSVPDGTDTSTLAALPCAEPNIVANIPKTQNSVPVEGGLQNGVLAAFAVRSVDEYANVGELSGVVTERPREVSDFFELYKSGGGDEKGGFCFIATAATGSYAHPIVRVLRAFRDTVMKQTPAGTFFVWSYYHASPPLAHAIERSPVLASSVRFALLPITFVALLLVLAPLAAIGVIVWRLTRRRRTLAVFSLVAALALGAAYPARAWETARPESALKNFGLGFSFKGGPYLPALAGDETFNEVFAEERNDDLTPKRGADANALYSIGIDLELYRGFGAAGIGGSFGFMQFVGRALLPDRSSVTHDTTVFNLMPLSLTAFYRFDVVADRIGIPFVPYVRGGLAYDVWWVTNGRGHVSRWKGDSDSSSSDDVLGRGGKWGFTGTVGMAILLNVFEPDASRALFDATLIRGTYFFIEWQADRVKGIPSEGFDLSDSTWNLGLYLEL